MATEHEIDRLIVTVIGDGSDYQNMIKEAEQSTDHLAREVEKDAKQIEQTGRSLETFAKSVVGAVTAYLGASQLQGFFDAFTVQEQAEMRLRAALEANERQVDSLFQDYAAFASELQNVTTQGDELTLVMLQQAEAMGITGEAAKKAVQGAVALSQSMGKSADESLRAIAKFNSGDLNALNEMFPALRTIADESEKVAKAQQLLADQFEIAQAIAESSAGEVAQLSNSWGDFKEQLGAVVAEGVGPVVDNLKDLVAWLQSLSPEVKQGIVIIGGAAVAVTGLSAAYGLLTLALGPVRALLISSTAATTSLATATRGATIAAIAFKGALLLGAVVGLKELIFAATGGNKALKELNQEIARSNRLSQDMVAIRERTRQRFFEGAEEISNLQLRMRSFQQELKSADRNAEDLSRSLESAKRHVEDMDDSRRQIPLIGEGWQADYDNAVKALGDVQQAYDETQNHAQRLRDEIQRLNREMARTQQLNRFQQERQGIDRIAQGEQAVHDEILQQINDMGKEFVTQSNVIDRAMTDTEEAIFRVKKAMEGQFFEGHPLSQELAKNIEGLQVLAKSFEDSRTIREYKDATEDLIQSLEMERDLLGVSNHLLDVHRIALAATKDQVDLHVQARLDEAGALAETVHALRRAQELTNQYRPDQLKMADAIAEIDKLLKDQLITQNVYNSALADIIARFTEAEEAASDYRRELERLEGTLAGTAEAEFRMAQHREVLGLQGQGGRPRVVPIPQVPGFQIDRGNVMPAPGMGGIPAILPGADNDKQVKALGFLERIAKAVEKALRVPGGGQFAPANF